MPSKALTQNFFKSFIWAFVSLGVIIFIGMHAKTDFIGWLIPLAIYAVGLGYQIYEYWDNNETLSPDAIMAVGIAAVMILGAA